MSWPFSIYKALCHEYPRERYIWIRIKILHETSKAILIDNGGRFWIPKSRIYKIRLKNNTFEVYTKETTIK